MQNSPLNPAGTATPFNNIVISSVTLTYVDQGGGEYAPPRNVALAVTVEAGSNGSIDIFPLVEDDLVADSTTVDVFMNFVAQTVSGHAVSVVGGGGGAQLVIEDCLP